MPKPSYCVLTYNKPHRKTQDTLYRIKALGIQDVSVLVLPWHERKNHKPIISHRPNNPINVDLSTFCKRLEIPCVKMSVENLADYLRKKDPSIALIAGAGVLPEDVVKACPIVNSHPGFLPNVRGLDALKWAIYEDQPIGITTHFITNQTDAGSLIDQSLVPIYLWDSFHSLAYRQYEMEIAMLVDAIHLVAEKKSFPLLRSDIYPVHRRMPRSKELEILERFEEIKKKRCLEKQSSPLLKS